MTYRYRCRFPEQDIRNLEGQAGKKGKFREEALRLAKELILMEMTNGGRDRDRTDDLYRVKVALVPTELRAHLGVR